MEKICPSCGAAPDASGDGALVSEEPVAVAAEPAVDFEPEAAASGEAAISEDPEAPAADLDAEAASEETASLAEAEASESDAPEAALEEPQEPAKPKKKDRGGFIAVGAVVVLALIIGACVYEMLQGRLGGRSSMNPSAVAVEVFNEDGAQVAQLTNEELSFYYWGEYYYFLQSYGMAFDPSLPLSEQAYDDDETWEDYFEDSAMASIQQTCALKLEAEAAGFQMPEEYQTQYDDTISYLAENAQYAGFTDAEGNGDVLAYIQDSVGEMNVSIKMQDAGSDYTIWGIGIIQ